MKKCAMLLAAILAIAMLLGFTVSCSDHGEKPSSEDEETTVDVLANLPKTRYNEDFVICCHGNEEFYREDSSGDNVDYAVYMRNRKIEDTYGVNLKCKLYSFDQIPAAVGNAVKASDANAMDTVASCFVYIFNIALQGNAQNWQDVPYLDLTADWWEDSCLEDLTMNDMTYIIVGDMNLSDIAYTYCMFYNKVLADEYHLEDLYDLAVNQKAWTYDKMLEIIQTVGKKDLNNDNKYNASDRYALLTASLYSANNYFWAFGGKVFSKNESTGEMEFTYLNDKTASIYKKLLKLYFRNENVYYRSDMIYANAAAELFVKDQGVLMNGMIDHIGQHFREIDSESWGMLPYPMWNAAQAKTIGYRTMVDGSANAWILPYFRGAQAAKTEKIGVVLEAMAALSHGGVRVEYLQKALKSKYVSDPVQAKMIDMILGSRVYDFGYVYIVTESPGFWIHNCMIGTKSDNVSGYYASKKNELNRAITETFAVFGMEFEGLN